MTQNLRQTPLTCSGHTRPVVFLSFSEFNPEDEANYYSISACKGIEKKHKFFYYDFLKVRLVYYVQSEVNCLEVCIEMRQV